MPSPPQDSQCGTVIDVSIDCAVKLIGTNCIIYPVNSKDLQHIWVSPPRPLPPFPWGSVLLLGAHAQVGAAPSQSDGKAQLHPLPPSERSLPAACQEAVHTRGHMRGQDQPRV